MTKKNHELDGFWTIVGWGVFVATIIITTMLIVTANAHAKDVVKEVYSPAVQIARDGSANCTGQFIHSRRDEQSGDVETYVLTAKHCTFRKPNFGYTINALTYDADLRKVATTSYEAEVFSTSWASDLAILKLVDKDTVFSNIAKIAPEDTKLTFGVPTIVAGYPMGLSLTVTEGRLGYREKVPFFDVASKSGEFLRSTPLVVGGSSGSALYTEVNDEYQIIGTLTGGGFGFMNFFTPLNEIHDYLKIAAKSWDTGWSLENVDVKPYKAQAGR